MVELSVQDSLSALFFGFVVGNVLFGVVLLESYRYFKTYKDDSISLHYCSTLDASHFAFSIHMAHYYLISNFGDSNAIAQAVWSVLGTIQVTLLWIVQCLYLIRIYTLTRQIIFHRKLIYPVMCTVVVIAVIGFVFIVELNRIVLILDFTKIKWAVYLGYGVSALVDIAITAIMVILLHRSITGIKRTDGVISVLIHYIFSTGLLTSMVALIYIILYAAVPQTLLYLGMVFLTSRLYTISFLELLHVRKQLRNNLNDTIPPELDFNLIKFKTGGMTSGSSPQTRGGTTSSYNPDATDPGMSSSIQPQSILTC
ncbi:hypothetical protein GYMLUDRAFT_76184 [Collybiopsis luxurians FD-317 M1]|uniref:DUF6534 domain-containing protein n=1 Tax=Collybiopsis luxurians FD-317 M1 TaxID=944289 RepID=A0A0D0C1J9_9AGAR|nr:hypothetical protein GYMLUDRAFT_76184 [Collybiopsis luxurians FD-317 M1]